MSKEWNEADEISMPEIEFVEPTEHYEWETKKEDSVQKQDQLHKKKMRKMLYGVASMVMVASLGQTLSNKESLPNLSEYPVLFNEYDEDTNYAKNGMITVGGANTLIGVGHVPVELRLVDYNGNPIEVETISRYGYRGKWINNNGYFLADTHGNDVYTLFDGHGKMLYEWKDSDYPKSNMISAEISNNNIVFIQREIKTEEGTIIKSSYFTIRGKELCSVECSKSGENGRIDYVGTPFREGIALCNDNNGILMIHEDGKTTRLISWPVESEKSSTKDRFQVGKDGTLQGGNGKYVLSNVPCTVGGNVSLGYFLVIDTKNNMALVDINTGRMYKIKKCNVNTSPEDEANNTAYLKYNDNEGNMLNIGSLMCKKETNKKRESKFYLFDVTKHCDDEGNRVGYLASHDAIYFENYKYLLARDGNEYFYIDHEGNKVSESYKKATTFNDFGYALVKIESGAIYVIDSEFNKLKRVQEIMDFQEQDYGEVFWVNCEGKSHSYYYGPDSQK